MRARSSVDHTASVGSIRSRSIREGRTIPSVGNLWRSRSARSWHIDVPMKGPTSPSGSPCFVCLNLVYDLNGVYVNNIAFGPWVTPSLHKADPIVFSELLRVTKKRNGIGKSRIHSPSSVIPAVHTTSPPFQAGVGVVLTCHQYSLSGPLVKHGLPQRS